MPLPYSGLSEEWSDFFRSADGEDSTSVVWIARPCLQWARPEEGYLAFLGSKTDESIRSYYVDKVIFSCKALDLEWGIMESQEAFGSTKRAMIGSGRKKILVVDSSKFDQTAFSVAGSMKEVDIIVTDKEPTERWKKHFEKFNVKCLYPV